MSESADSLKLLPVTPWQGNKHSAISLRLVLVIQIRQRLLLLAAGNQLLAARCCATALHSWLLNPALFWKSSPAPAAAPKPLPAPIGRVDKHAFPLIQLQNLVCRHQRHPLALLRTTVAAIAPLTAGAGVNPHVLFAQIARELLSRLPVFGIEEHLGATGGKECPGEVAPIDMLQLSKVLIAQQRHKSVGAKLVDPLGQIRQVEGRQLIQGDHQGSARLRKVAGDDQVEDGRKQWTHGIALLDIHLQKQNALAGHIQRNGGLAAEAGDQLLAGKGFEGALGGGDNSGNLLIGLLRGNQLTEALHRPGRNPARLPACLMRPGRLERFKILLAISRSG
jgi:hypothetical protein